MIRFDIFIDPNLRSYVKCNLITTSDAMNNTTSYTYNTTGNMLTMTAANNNSTSYTYDTYGNMVYEINPVSRCPVRQSDGGNRP